MHFGVLSKRQMHVETQQMNESKFDPLLGWHLRPVHVLNLLCTKQLIYESRKKRTKIGYDYHLLVIIKMVLLFDILQL